MKRSFAAESPGRTFSPETVSRYSIATGCFAAEGPRCECFRGQTRPAGMGASGPRFSGEAAAKDSTGRQPWDLVPKAPRTEGAFQSFHRRARRRGTGTIQVLIEASIRSNPIFALVVRAKGRVIVRV